MLEVNAPKAMIATTTQVRNGIKETFEEAQERVVYVVSNSKAVGAVIGLKHLKLLEEALEREAEERIAAIALDRFKRLEEGEGRLLDEDLFWEKVKQRRQTGR